MTCFEPRARWSTRPTASSTRSRKYLRAGERPGAADRSPVTLQDIADDVFLLVHDACGLTCLTRQLFAARRIALREYEGQSASYQVLEEWTRVGVGSAILPESKLSAPGLGHPIGLGNGRRATIRFEAAWLPTTAPAPFSTPLPHTSSPPAPRWPRRSRHDQTTRTRRRRSVGDGPDRRLQQW